jgi:membrane-bound serine protease (ClpP class)
MDAPVYLFALFVVLGLMLIGIEVFVPGGIIGIFGALFLFAAAVTAFFAFGPQVGFFAAIALVFGTGVFLFAWLKIFPGTGVGRMLTLQSDGRNFKSASGDADRYLNKEGVAQSSLRPAGIAVIDNQRVDVVSESGYIESGARVQVILVEGARIVVREVKSS